MYPDGGDYIKFDNKKFCSGYIIYLLFVLVTIGSIVGFILWLVSLM